MKQGLDKPKADGARIRNELQRRYVRIVGANLAIADDAITGELETGDAKLGNPHERDL